MSICKNCRLTHDRESDLCVKCYLKEYHKKNYKKIEKSCAICGVISHLGHKKYCANCIPKIKSTCITCGKEFFYGAKYKYCTSCQYHREKETDPERYKVNRLNAAKKYNAKLRESKGLPVDHVFPKGPRGKGYLNKKGYILMVYKCPKTKKTMRKYQHVLVMMNHLGRDLCKNERVHHKNGDRSDNRLENLELWNIGQPAGQRTEDKIKWYIEFLKQHGYKVEIE